MEEEEKEEVEKGLLHVSSTTPPALCFINHSLDDRKLSSSCSLPGKTLESPTEDKISKLVKDGISPISPNSMPKDLDSLSSRKSKYEFDKYDS